MDQIVAYTLKDVIKMLHVSRNTLLRLIYKKELKATKVGNSYRIMQHDLKEFLVRNGSSDFSVEEGTA